MRKIRSDYKLKVKSKTFENNYKIKEAAAIQNLYEIVELPDFYFIVNRDLYLTLTDVKEDLLSNVFLDYYGCDYTEAFKNCFNSCPDEAENALREIFNRVRDFINADIEMERESKKNEIKFGRPIEDFDLDINFTNIGSKLDFSQITF